MSVFNLDNVSLSKAEQTALGLGHKYLPNVHRTHTQMMSSIKQSLQKLSRNIKLKLFFAYTANNNMFSCIPRLLNNSFMPPATEDYVRMVDRYIGNAWAYVRNLKLQCRFSQLDYALLQVINNIRSRTDIVVKPADKNLGTVVLSTDHYRRLCLDHLLDPDVYCPIDKNSDFLRTAWQRLEDILRAHDVFYSNKRENNGQQRLSKLALSLLQLRHSPELRAAANFYILPKVHKSPIIGRPIAASINTVTYFASKYLDNLLQPVMKKLPGICFSSREVVKELHELTLPNDCFILCADVKNLYPSIPIDYGLKAVREVLLNYRFENEQLDLVIDLLGWVLTTNYISFGNDIYLQVSGTAMGTPVAVCYANIVLFYLEQKCIDTQPVYYKRFIDDIFAIVKSQEQGSRIVDLFNQQCKGIRLDAVTIGKQGVFLDLQLYIARNRVVFSLFQKPSNKYLYLHFQSAHSKKLMANIIREELKRYRLFCCENKDFIDIVLKFHGRLLARGYPRDFLQPIFSNLPDRSLLLERLFLPNTTRTQDCSAPVVIFQLPKLCKEISWRDVLQIPDELKAHDRFQRAYTNDKVIIGRRLFKHLGEFFHPTL
jgi:hypothetical protein